MTDYGWDPQEVIETAGYGAPIAAYECDNCGTTLPVHFTRDTEEPPEELPTYICGTRWNGCDQTISATLVSDGYVVEYEQ